MRSHIPEYSIQAGDVRYKLRFKYSMSPPAHCWGHDNQMSGFGKWLDPEVIGLIRGSFLRWGHYMMAFGGD